jgi:hypothetical protein
MHLVPARIRPVIERLVRQRDRARAEARGERVRILRWRCGPTFAEKMEDFNDPS